MQRFKQPGMDLHPDGEWIRYEDHIDAMKRIAGQADQSSGDSACAGQAGPVADTGWGEADAIIGRLMSDDPDFDDCRAAAVFIRRMALRDPAASNAMQLGKRRQKNICPHGIHMDNACGACIPPRGTTARES